MLTNVIIRQLLFPFSSTEGFKPTKNLIEDELFKGIQLDFLLLHMTIFSLFIEGFEPAKIVCDRAVAKGRGPGPVPEIPVARSNKCFFPSL